MEAIGRRLFYEKATGRIVQHIGERAGSVRVTELTEDYPEYNPALHGVKELKYDERFDEFLNLGSYYVSNTGELVIIPRLKFALDKERITTAEVAQLTVSVPDANADIITVIVEGTAFMEPLAASLAVFNFTAEVEGRYTLLISSDKHGSALAVVEVVPE